MHITANKTDLSAALTGLGRIVSKRIILPVLSMVQVTADQDGAVTVSGTDLEQWASYRLNAEADGPGDCLIGLKALRDGVRASNSPAVGIVAGGAKDAPTVAIQGFAVETMPVDEMPPSPTAVVQTYPAGADFCSAYRKLIPFASTEEVRYILNGVNVEGPGRCFGGKKCKTPLMVATDGRRLSLQTMPRFRIGKDDSYVVRTSKFLATTKLPAECNIGVSVAKLSPRWIQIEAGPWTYMSTLIEGTFPNWPQVVPDIRAKEPTEDWNPVYIELAASDLPALLEALSMLPHDHVDGPVHASVELFGEGDRVCLTSSVEGSPTVRLDASKISRPVSRESAVAVARGFLREALKAGYTRWQIDPDGVTKPLCGSNGNGGLHVVMPMRIR